MVKVRSFEIYEIVAVSILCRTDAFEFIAYSSLEWKHAVQHVAVS